MSSPRYDAEEAIALMAQTAEDLAPDIFGHEKAALALVERLEGLDGEAGFSTKREGPTACWLLLRGRDGQVLGAAKVWQHDHGKITVQSRGGRAVEVTLKYNRLTMQLEGEQLDTFYVPSPGQAPRRRSALAVVVEQALELIRSESR
jgi:hypothetical protein